MPEDPVRNLPGLSRRATPRAAVAALLRSADEVRRHLAATMEAFDVTGQQYNVLRILRGAYPQPLPTLEIAERMLERTPGITRLLDRLEKKGLVTRERHAGDRRQVLCTITQKGLDLLVGMEEAVQAANETAFAMLDARELQELVRLLDSVAAGKE